MYNDLWPAPYPAGDHDFTAIGSAGDRFAGFAQPAGTTVTVTLRYSPLGFLLGLFTPVLVVDGRPVPARWRRPVTTPVEPGPHHVHAHVPYLLPRRVGSADLMVTTRPGENLELEYRAPLIVFMRGALGGGRQRYPGMAVTIVMLVLTLVLGACAFGGAALTARNVAAPVPAADVERDIPPLPALPSVRPSLPSSPGGAGLRTDVEQQRITGAVFGAGDETVVTSFPGWPFAFRAPGSWECTSAQVDLPEASAYICIDDKSGRRLAVMLRACVAPCGAARQKAMTGAWFRAGEKPRRFGANTRFVEVRQKYQLVVSHFFGDGSGGSSDEGSGGSSDDGTGGFSGDGARWQIAMDATSPVKGRGVMQKVVNDIMTQTS